MALGEHVDGTTNPDLEATLPPHSCSNQDSCYLEWMDYTIYLYLRAGQQAPLGSLPCSQCYSIINSSTENNRSLTRSGHQA